MTAVISRKRRKIRSIMLKLLSVVLAVLLMSEYPLSHIGIASAEEAVLYLKEVKLFYADSAADARETSQNQGYIFVDTDLNAGTTKNYVYLGYRTTTNRDEAIYKISLLDMNTGYEMRNYGQLYDEYRKSNFGTAQTLQMATLEFIDSYNSGSPKALDAYEGMNLLYIPEAGDMKFGDYVVSGKTDDDFYATVLTQSSSSAVSSIINFLYAGLAPYDPESEVSADSGYNPDSWAALMEDSALWSIVGSSRISRDEAAALDREYADDAKALFKQMQSFATSVENARSTYDKNELMKESLNTSLDEIVEEMDEIEESDTGAVYIEAYNLLNQYNANSDMPLGEWIVEMGSMTSEEADITQIYPMIDSMSNAQVKMTELIGFVPCATSLGKNERSGEYQEILNSARSKLKELLGKDAISMWASCDPELKNASYIAYTNEAIRKSAAQSLLNAEVNDLAQNIFEDIETAFKWLGLVGSGITVATFMFGGFFIGGLLMLIAKVASCAALASAATTMISVCGVLGSIGGILGIAVLAATILYFAFRAIWDWYWNEIADRDYTSMPQYVIDAVKVDKGCADVKYKAVYNQRGGVGDLNGYEGHKGWVCMYTSTDPRVGSPIRADESGNIFRVAFGDSSKPDDRDCVNFFGQITPGNCNTNAEEDNVGGIYITYYTEDSLKNRSPGQNQTTNSDGKDKKDAKKEDQKKVKYYYTDLVVKTARDEDKAKSKIAVAGKYIWDQNLSYNARTRWEKGGQYTYIGYEVTTDPDEAVRDIRVATFNPSGEIYFGDIKYGCAGTIGYPATTAEEDKDFPKDLDGLFFTCDKRAGEPIEVGKLHLVGGFSDAQPDWEPVTTFSGAPYNFATTRYNSQGVYAYLPGRMGNYPFSYTGYCTNTDYTWNEADRYLYYEPEKTYISGDVKYLSGMFFAYGSDSESTSAYKTAVVTNFSQLTDKLKTFPNTTVLDYNNLAQPYYYNGMFSEDEQKKLYLCYTWSYNPYRAIYGISVFQGPSSSTTLPYNLQKTATYKETYSGTPQSHVSYTAASVIVQRSTQPEWAVRAISPENAFICPTGLQGQNPQIQEFRTDDRTGFFRNVGLSTRGWLPTGLYVCGYVPKKNPLTLGDIVITSNAYTAEENNGILSVPIEGEKTLAGSYAEGIFTSVQDLKSPADTVPYNFAYPTSWSDENDKTVAGTPLYIYFRNTVYKKKYISRVFVGQCSRKAAETDDEDILKEFDKQVDLNALAAATAAATDEVIPINVAADQDNAWYNREDSKHSHIDPKPAENQPAAYLSVSRTDNPDEAIRGLMLFKASPDSAVANQVNVDGATYYCASNSAPIRMSNGNSYYLYYTYNIGASTGGPITSIYAGKYPFVSGRVTALTADRADSGSSRAALKGDTTMKTFIWGAFETANHVYFNKIYAAYGANEEEAMLKLLEQGCTQYISIIFIGIGMKTELII